MYLACVAYTNKKYTTLGLELAQYIFDLICVPINFKLCKIKSPKFDCTYLCMKIDNLMLRIVIDLLAEKTSSVIRSHSGYIFSFLGFSN